MILGIIGGALWAQSEELVRVDVPDYPGALVTSHAGSMLAAPPGEDISWRYESLPVTDEIVGDVGGDDLDETLGVSQWHEAGYRGQGVKVAVFDVKWYGVEIDSDELADVETHDCYAHTACTVPMDTLRPRFSFEAGVHGVACAELIRDVAPEAELHLVRVNGLTTFENAAAWAAREGIDVVSLSMSFFNESFYDTTGSVSDAVELMADAGVLLVTSVGNYARGHFQDTFRDLDGDGYHEFPWGSEELSVEIGSGSGRVLSMNWDEYDTCGQTDLDLVLFDGDGNRVGVADRSQDSERKNCTPVERLDATRESGGWYSLKIQRTHGRSAVAFDVLSTKARLFRSVSSGSVPDPGAHPLVLAVGAVRADDYLSSAPESFSSVGPTHAGFSKPDLLAPNGLTTSVYGPSGFFGTSASAPVAAGAIALWMSRDPDLDSYEAAQRVRDTAWSDSAVWEQEDSEMGAGRLFLGAPLNRGCGGTLSFVVFLPWAVLLRRKSISGMTVSVD